MQRCHMDDHGYAFAQGQFDRQEGPDPFIDDDFEINESEEDDEHLSENC